MILLIILLSLTLPIAAGAIWLPALPAPAAMYAPAFIARDDLYVYLVPSDSIGVCAPDNRRACATYAYIALELWWSDDKFVGRPPTWSELLAITYYGECFYRDDICADALFRGIFDRQSGACPYAGGQYTCTWARLIDWLSGMQHWVNSVRMADDGAYVMVNWRRLTGIRDDRETGYPYYQEWLDALVMRRLRWVRSGQGNSVPSVWGNVCVMPGQKLEGTIFRRRVVGTCGENDAGTNVFIVVPATNRHKVIGS